jgi:hypothetical protein
MPGKKKLGADELSEFTDEKLFNESMQSDWASKHVLALYSLRKGTRITYLTAVSLRRESRASVVAEVANRIAAKGHIRLETVPSVKDPRVVWEYIAVGLLPRNR